MGKYGESPWGGNHIVDDTAILLSGDGKRCSDCKRVTWNKFLHEDRCPDCYREKYGQESPALTAYREERNRSHTGCACGDAGEAD